MPNFFSLLIRFTIKVILAFLGLIFAVSLLLAAMLLLLVSSLKWLVTGKKPAPLIIFSRFKKFTAGGVWTNATRAKNDADVVDVEVREVNANDVTASPTQLKSHRPPPE